MDNASTATAKGKITRQRARTTTAKTVTSKTGQDTRIDKGLHFQGMVLCDI